MTGDDEIRSGCFFRRTQRFIFHHVQTSAREPAFSQSGEDRSFFDDRSPRSVDYESGRFHPTQLASADQMPCLRSQRAMKGEDIGVAEQFLESTNPADSSRLVRAVREVRVVKANLEAKGFGSQRRGGANPAQTNNSKGLLAQSPHLRFNC